MKRIASFAVVLIMLASFAIMPASAYDSCASITYFEDGSYAVTAIEEVPARASGTKTGSKTTRFYNAKNELEYMITVTGTFSYGDTGVECTYAGGTTSIVKSNQFSLASESAVKDGDTATYTATIKHKILGIVINKETYSVSLTCDKNRNLS